MICRILSDAAAKDADWPLSRKFGCVPDMAINVLELAHRSGLVAHGIAFHVGSQQNNVDAWDAALAASAAVFRTCAERGIALSTVNLGGGFPAHYDEHVKPFSQLAKKINAEIERLFPEDIQILAEPGRFLVATAATSVARIIGKAVRDSKQCYYINDSVYHTLSGIIFDHCQYHVKSFRKGEPEISIVFGQTCDGLDTISQAEALPPLEIDDLVYSEDIGAYSNASSTRFNGFAPATIVHVNQ